MFSESAKFYDRIYSFKDYSKEASQVHEAIQSHRTTNGGRLLDVACGTGKHLAEFDKWYQVWGLDLDANLLALARSAAPSARLLQGDMRTFKLDQQFDAVTCLFSSIGYMTTKADLKLAIRNMADHLQPGGVLVIEPWLYPENFISDHLHMLTVDDEDCKIVRLSRGTREGHLSLLDFEYLIMTAEETIRASERHETGLYTRDEYGAAMVDAGLTVEYDPIGLMNRGLFIGTKPA